MPFTKLEIGMQILMIYYIDILCWNIQNSRVLNEEEPILAAFFGQNLWKWLSKKIMFSYSLLY